MIDENKNLDMFIVWHPFQQRAKVLSDAFGARPCWLFYSWEKKNKFFKLLSYFLKSLVTLYLLIKKNPRRIFMQLPPVPLLYVASIYGRFSDSQLVFDGHNSLFCSHWARWPLVKRLLDAKGVVLLTHNEDISIIAERLGIHSMTLIDPLPAHNVDSEIGLPASLEKGQYVIVPFSFSDDEPVEELLEAARLLPEQRFAVTWFKEKAISKVSSTIPDNIVFTGFLDLDVYQSLFSNALCALALTTRDGTQPSVATEAIGFGVPLVVSDIGTTRKLYDKWPIYVDNDAEGIVSGIARVKANVSDIKARMQSLHERINDMHQKQFVSLQELLVSNECDT